MSNERLAIKRDLSTNYTNYTKKKKKERKKRKRKIPNTEFKKRV